MKYNSISGFESNNEIELFEMNGAKLTIETPTTKIMLKCSFDEDDFTKLWISYNNLFDWKRQKFGNISNEYIAPCNVFHDAYFCVFFR